MEKFSASFPLWLCDVWGVIHNGYQWFGPAAKTLAQHRQQGGLVILLTNSPRSSSGVVRQLNEMGVPREAYDLVVTSGDVTRTLLVQQAQGKVYHIGPDRDLSILEGLDIERVAPDQAHAVLCTGLDDDGSETAEDYRARLQGLIARGLPMICANPDKIVRKGDRLIYCAGALAELYSALGGKVLMAGKPYAPIYQLAQKQAEELAQRSFDRNDMLAIGDGPETDIRGAADNGIAAVLIADGVTDASLGLEEVRAQVQAAVPHAKILATLPYLDWQR